MTETRELLRAAIGEGEPAIPPVEGVMGRADAHRRRERIAAAVLALVLTAGLATGLVTALHGHGGGGPSEGDNVVGPTRQVFIPSESMTPTLEVGDTVLVDEGAYANSGGLPSQGDVIAFDLTRFSFGGEFVKRAIGLPGDVIEERAGVMFVNGEAFPMPEPATPDHHTLGPWTVEPGHVFVVGDDLGNSNDSRYGFGQIALRDIVGKVVEILSPGDRRATVGPPTAPAASSSASETGS